MTKGLVVSANLQGMRSNKAKHSRPIKNPVLGN